MKQSKESKIQGQQIDEPLNNTAPVVGRNGVYFGDLSSAINEVQADKTNNSLDSDNSGNDSYIQEFQTSNDDNYELYNRSDSTIINNENQQMRQIKTTNGGMTNSVAASQVNNQKKKKQNERENQINTQSNQRKNLETSQNLMSQVQDLQTSRGDTQQSNIQQLGSVKKQEAEAAEVQRVRSEQAEKENKSMLEKLIRSILIALGIIKEEEKTTNIESIDDEIEKKYGKDIRLSNIAKKAAKSLSGEDNYKLLNKESKALLTEDKGNDISKKIEQNKKIQDLDILLSYPDLRNKYATKTIAPKEIESGENKIFSKSEANTSNYTQDFVNSIKTSSIVNDIYSNLGKSNRKKIVQYMVSWPMTEEKRILQFGYIAALNDKLESSEKQPHISEIAKLLKEARSTDDFNEKFENYKINQAKKFADAEALQNSLDGKGVWPKATSKQVETKLKEIEAQIEAQINAVSTAHGMTNLMKGSTISKNQSLNPFSKYKGISIETKLKEQDRQTLKSIRDDLNKNGDKKNSAINAIVQQMYGNKTVDSKGNSITKTTVEDAKKHYKTMQSFINIKNPSKTEEEKKALSDAIVFFQTHASNKKNRRFYQGEPDIEKLSRRMNGIIASGHLNKKIQDAHPEIGDAIKNGNGEISQMKQGEHFKNAKHYTETFVKDNMTKNDQILTNASKGLESQKQNAEEIYTKAVNLCDPRTGKLSESATILNKFSYYASELKTQLYDLANESNANKFTIDKAIETISDTRKEATQGNFTNSPTQSHIKHQETNRSDSVGSDLLQSQSTRANSLKSIVANNDLDLSKNANLVSDQSQLQNRSFTESVNNKSNDASVRH